MTEREDAAGSQDGLARALKFEMPKDDPTADRSTRPSAGSIGAASLPPEFADLEDRSIMRSAQGLMAKRGDGDDSRLGVADRQGRHVLVMTLGCTPAIVTETVWALFNRSPTWIPQEIYLVTTIRGTRDWTDPTSRANRELTAVYERFETEPVRPQLIVPEISAGKPITDLRTEEQSIAFANGLTWLIKELKEDSRTRLHVSMAGGRKTMSSYAQAAISFFAEEDDELTHTLVEPSSLESSIDFFWPEQEQQEVGISERTLGSSAFVMAAAATVTLVPSPFLRLRPYINRIPFAKQKFDHWTLVKRAQDRLGVQAIRLRLDDQSLLVNGEVVRFGNQEFALYRVLAAAIDESWRGVGPDGQGGNHVGWVLIKDFLDPRSLPYKKFFEFYHDCFKGVPDEAYWRFRNDVEYHLKLKEIVAGQDYVSARFKTLRNKIKQRLDAGIVSYSARRRVMPDTRSLKPKGRSYGLALERHEIEILPRTKTFRER